MELRFRRSDRRSGNRTPRNRQVKNLFNATVLSVGVPMFVMGDEVRRSQRGNNNAYCQDNDTSWFDWTLLSKHADVHRFVKLLIERRVIRDVEHEQRRASLTQVLRESKHALHGVKLNQPDWSPLSHSFAISGELKNERLFAHIMFNAYWEPLDFELPAWRTAAGTGGDGSIRHSIHRMIFASGIGKRECLSRPIALVRARSRY